MNIPSKFEGKIYFYWHAEYGFMHTSIRKFARMDEYIYLGESDDISVTFAPREEINAQAVASMEEMKARILAAAHVKCEEIDGQIQSLLAITHDGGE